MLKSDFLFLEKPHGWSTHSPRAADDAQAQNHFGLHEWARSYHPDSPLFVCHRLDRETSGAILFAKNIEAARALGNLFENHEVQKSYFFITKARSPKSHFDYSSFIEKVGDHFVSSNKTPNSFTTFEKIDALDDFELWRANPKSGKPHQIRLHAEALGIPILGDRSHGGAPFSRLMLHSHSLKFQIGSEQFHFESPLPHVFENLELFRRIDLAEWMSAAERRSWWLKNVQEITSNQFLAQNDTWRWLHTETRNLRAEQLGEIIFFYWYSDHLPSSSQIQNLELFYDFLLHLNGKLQIPERDPQFFLQLRSDRQKSPRDFGEIKSTPGFLKRWKARENSVHYELRIDSGLSTGLFLDQRNNRNWLAGNCRGKRVLNLFSYTGGFSLCAAKAQASKVVSVDVSANFLEWSKHNFALNDIPLDTHEFRKMDSLEYLRWAKKKNLKFDMVVCDPPSFSRVDKKIFKIDKALPELLELLSAVIEVGGRILFCSNFEDLSSRDFLRLMNTSTKSLGLVASEFRIIREDFELPHQEALMKSFLLEKI